MLGALEYPAVCEANYKAFLAENTGFKPEYTFYHDLSVAEWCQVHLKDKNAIKQTINTCKNQWRSNIKAMTELCMAINYKAWAHNDRVDSEWLGCDELTRMDLVQFYSDAYYDCDNYIAEVFKNDKKALAYYYETID